MHIVTIHLVFGGATMRLDPCPKCGDEYLPAQPPSHAVARFCSDCGVRLVQECPRCFGTGKLGSDLYPIHCTGCGRKLGPLCPHCNGIGKRPDTFHFCHPGPP